MNTQHWLLAALWLLFGVVHSITASKTFKGFIERIAGSYFIYYTLAYSFIALLTLLPVIYYQFSIVSFYLFQPTGVIIFISVGGIVFATIVSGYSIFKYFVPLSGVAFLVNKSHKPDLKTNGLNRYMRHPLYFGTLLMIWSIFLWFPLLSSLVACIAITLYTLSGIYLEEKKLSMVFGDEYIVYKRRVPMLIPFTKKAPVNKIV